MLVRLAVMLALVSAVTQDQGTKTMSREEVEILKRVNEFVSAWQRGDAKAVMAVWAEDGVRVGAFGDVSKGPKEIETAYQKLFSGPMKGARISYEPTVRLVTTEVALVEGPLAIQPEGGAPPLKGYALDVWRKKDGRWSLLEGHPKLFPASPSR
jgi:uncharacterized protein (TIGR02246 family)